MALAIVTAGSVQLLSVPGGGSANAGAAVTPPVTGTGQAGRVPPAATSSGGLQSGGGLHSDIVEKGGCESWGTTYVGTAYIHEATSGGTIYGAWSVTRSGGVTSEKAGVAPFYGSLQSVTICPNDPVDSIAATGDSKGYWLATSGGGVYAFGDAGYAGSRATGGFTGAIMAIASDNGTSGYWLVSQLGQVFSYGGANYYGGSPSTLVAKHDYFGDSVTAIASSTSGHGYWLMTNYGTVYAYGDAGMPGFNDPGLGGTTYNWYTAIGAAPPGGGFWMVRMFGQTYAFGATYYGNPGLSSPGDFFVALADSTSQSGYILMNMSGQPYAYGDAIHPTNPPYVPPRPHRRRRRRQGRPPSRFEARGTRPPTTPNPVPPTRSTASRVICGRPTPTSQCPGWVSTSTCPVRTTPMTRPHWASSATAGPAPTR